MPRRSSVVSRRALLRGAVATAAVVVALAALGCDDSTVRCVTNDDCAGSGLVNPYCNSANGACYPRGSCRSWTDCVSFYPGHATPFCNPNGVCIDQGPCTTSEQCPPDWTCNAGRCEGELPLPDGDQETTDGDGGDGDLDPDGGDDPADNETDTDVGPQCGEVWGSYDVDSTCDGAPISGTVLISQSACTVTIFLPGQDQPWTGTVAADGTIRVSAPRQCTGRADGSTLTLDCGGNCGLGGTVTPGTGLLRVDPELVDFQSVPAGTEATKRVRIINRGDVPVTIHRAFIAATSHPDYFLLDDVEFPATIDVAATLEINVQLISTDNRPKSGELKILNSTAQAQITVPLTSRPKDVACLTIEPSTINVGSVPTGATNTKPALLKNPCDATATLTGLRIVEDASGAFAIVAASAPALPYGLGGGQGRQFVVSCSPVEGVHSDAEPLIGTVEATYIDQEGSQSTVTADLRCQVVAPSPSCIEIDPMEGVDLGQFGSTVGQPGIRFGATQLFSNQARPLRITNCGDQDLVIHEIVWGVENFILCLDTSSPWPVAIPHCEFSTVPALPAGNIVIPRGQSYTLDVIFTPTVTQQVRAQWIFVRSNASTVGGVDPFNPPDWARNAAEVGVVFSGVGATRGIEVLPSKLEFGLITVGCCSRWEPLTLYDTGDLPLDVQTVRLTGTSDRRFEIDLGSLTLPTQVPGGGTMTFLVRFCAEREGVANGAIEIVSNDATQDVYVVPLKGEGTLLTFQRDEFLQPVKPTVDILWTVDCSGSMSEEQNNLGRNFSAFITEATTWRADFQTSIISMDVDNTRHNGHILGNPKVKNFERMGSSIVSSFSTDVRLGTNCSGTELGLEASRRALSPPLITDPAENQPFLRSDAVLTVVYVSDEEDQSESDVGFYTDFLKNIKGFRNVEMLRVYSIVGPRGGCNSSDGEAAAGHRYMDVAAACGGFSRSICESDFSPVYRDIGRAIFGLRRQFFLSRLPEPSSIVVTVDGQPRASPTHYTYDEESNSIIFNDPPPGPGARIVVEYDTLCLR